MKTIQHFTCLLLAGYLIISAGCQQPGGNSTGSEFIPDMAHSVAYEPNVLTEYSLHTWDKESTMSRRALSQPMLPVSGTIARGYTGAGANESSFATAEEAVNATLERLKTDGALAFTPNGNVPYYYPDTEEGRTLATQQIKFNPFPITKAGIAKGQELYNIYCGICHGEKGDGGGYLVEGPSAKYPAQPANLVDSQFVFSSNGRYYHSIMYGKNAMGSYADKLSYEERWQVIHYIRSLQAQARKVKYSDEENSLVAEFGVPSAKLGPAAQKEPPVNIGEIPNEEPSKAEEAIIKTNETEKQGGGGN